MFSPRKAIPNLRTSSRILAPIKFPRKSWIYVAIKEDTSSPCDIFYDYLRLRWNPHGCYIPGFDKLKMLKMLKGKRLVFVGDSLNRNIWESLVCALRNSLNDKNKVNEVSGCYEFRCQGFYSFKFNDFKCSIDFIKSPLLVQEWKFSDKAGARRETLRLE
ncbi:Protein trichome birefringence-like 4 [Capsicum chinense]|nr:Protein trichome birefringence-like 4 [Capsicum chinense]